MPTPALYQNITSEVDKRLLVSQEMVNVINLTDVRDADVTVKEKIVKYLAKVGKASLSPKLWDPTKTKLELEVLTMKRESCDIKQILDYEDWKVLLKQGAWDIGIEKIGQQPAIQASHKMFQGTKLLDDSNNKGDGAYKLKPQYNHILDVGAANHASTILRPIGCNSTSGAPNTWQTSSGLWSTYLNMATDINQVEFLFSHGFNRETTYCFYPNAASPAMGKKRVATGVGFKNAFMELADHGIPEDRIRKLPNPYMTTIGGVTPTNALFDLHFVDMKSIITFEPVRPFVNSFVDPSGTRFPEMTIEAGLTMIQMFKPEWHVDTATWRKGVAVVSGCIGT